MIRKPRGASAVKPRPTGLSPVAPPRCLLGKRELSSACARPPRESSRTDRSVEPLIVGGGTVDRRHLYVVQTQVDRELAAMVREVVDRIAQHHVTRLLGDDLAGDEQSPRLHQ